MPKEDDIEHILNSLDHLLREGFDDDQKPAKPAEKESDTDEELSEVHVDDGLAKEVETEIPVEPGKLIDEEPEDTETVVPPPEPEDEDAFDESAADQDQADDTLLESDSALNREESHRLLLSEDMLDDGSPADQSEPVADGDGDVDIQALATAKADQEWLDEEEKRAKPSGEQEPFHSLHDEQTRADFAQMVSSDVTARLAEQVPLLVEECLIERLAELDAQSSK